MNKKINSSMKRENPTLNLNDVVSQSTASRGFSALCACEIKSFSDDFY